MRKSTLLRCINALENIQSGEIRLHGELVTKRSRNLTGIRQKIGMVFQSYELFPHLNVLDNILLAPTKVQKRTKDEVKKEALALLSRVGLAEKRKVFRGSYLVDRNNGLRLSVHYVCTLKFCCLMR